MSEESNVIIHSDCDFLSFSNFYPRLLSMSFSVLQWQVKREKLIRKLHSIIWSLPLHPSIIQPSFSIKHNPQSALQYISITNTQKRCTEWILQEIIASDVNFIFVGDITLLNNHSKQFSCIAELANVQMKKYQEYMIILVIALVAQVL